MPALITAIAVVLGLVLTATGAILWAQAEVSATVQASQLLHLAAGWLCIPPVAWDLWRHYRLRGTSLSGLVNAALLLLVTLTGAAHSIIALLGGAEQEWLMPLHLITSVGLVVVVVVHIGVSLKKRPGAKWTRRWAIPGVLAATLAAASIVGLGGWLDGVQAAPERAAYSNPYGNDSPFAPSNVMAAEEGFVHPARLSGSAACGTCHGEIFKQWSESMHRYAATDPHVDVGIRWFQRDNGAEAGRFCAGCHNPIALLAGEYDPETTPPDTGTPAHPEGISCLSCHAITGIQTEPLGNGSYTLDPPAQPMVAGPIADLLIRLDVPAHKRQMMRRPLMQTAQFCGTCHQQYTPTSLNGPGPGQDSNQYPEWIRSSYADEGSDNFKTCNDCHMPLVKGEDPAAIDGKIHSHRFIGANHAHAVAAGHEEQARLTLEFLRQGVTLGVDVPKAQSKGDHLLVDVSVTNKNVGHHFPSGTTDISQVWLEVVAGDSDKPLYASGLIDDRHYVDPKAKMWRKVFVDSANVPVDLHNLAVVAKTTLDDYIRPGRTDTRRYEIPLNGLRKGTVPVRVRLRMRKANQRWNDWLSNFDGSTIEITEIHEDVVSVDLAAHRFGPGVAESAPTAPANNAPAVSGMVFVPAGPAIIGSDDGDADEKPIQNKDVGAFYIDRFPVTNSEYKRFVRANGRRGPVHKLDWAAAYNWNGQQYPEGTADQPVVLVNREEAKSFCAWRGKRLPREVEWEKAARGPSGRKYPWGDRWEDGACPQLEGKDIPPRVGMCPQRASPYGAQEMVGGVFEWVEDAYAAYDRTFLHPNANEWINTFGDPSYVLRGAPAGHEGPATTATSRAGHSDNMRAKIGFRCVKEGPNGS